MINKKRESQLRHIIGKEYFPEAVFHTSVMSDHRWYGIGAEITLTNISGVDSDHIIVSVDYHKQYFTVKPPMLP